MIQEQQIKPLNNQQVHKNQQNLNKTTKKINIALVSDFYYPFVGGVEIHIKQLARQLSKHQKIGNIIVITHKYDHHSGLKYTGVRNQHGFRVYYLNIHYNRQYMITYPTFLFNFNSAAKILKQQQIDIVHCHQTGSTLSLQFIFFSKILGKRVILTEHSLYGFRSLFDIHFNRATKYFVSLCEKVIAVSKTTRNNVILRTEICANRVVVIPNGVCDISKAKKVRQEFLQNKNKQLENGGKKQGEGIIKIVSVGRMTYRRGTDLLIQIIPQLCRDHPKVQLTIIGDGIKRRALQKIVQINQLQTRVKILGVIADHQKLLQQIAKCDIFLNTPLTESFGIALAQAAMLGLYCVSTNVGGVEEAVPSQYLFTSDIEPGSLLQVISRVIQKITREQRSIRCVKKFEYKWENMCQRTVQLYQSVMKQQVMSRRLFLINTIKTGNFFQMFFAVLALFLIMIHSLPFFK